MFRLENWGNNKGLSLSRIEQDGVEQRQGIELAGGEQVSGVKLVLTQNTGTIRGQIKIEGMDYPDEALVALHIRRTGDVRAENLYAVVDSRGRFILEGVAPGEYELMADVTIGRPSEPQAEIRRATQVVTVSNGAVSEATLVLKPAAKDN
jgi:hypothetical protein